MPVSFKPDGAALLIGSQPLRDHDEATRLVLEYVAEIPNWVQLPLYRNEGMVEQYMSGLPGLVRKGDRYYVDFGADNFDDQMLAFFEDYLLVSSDLDNLDKSRFVLTADTAPGLFSLMAALGSQPHHLRAVKGQTTGPITFCTALQDQEQRAIFYHEALRDTAVKMLALKAAWQAKLLGSLGVPVIIFIDEPALAGYGSSEFISISRQDINDALQEVIDAIHAQGALAGVHVCANTDWSLLLESDVDIVNFDGYSYFDKLILYADQLKRFLSAGRFLAWGLVPTLAPEQIEDASVESLWRDWTAKVRQLSDKGIDPAVIKARAFVTPACGTGSLTPELSRKVLALTQELSRRIRAN